MCEKCSGGKIATLIAVLRHALGQLDRENEHAAAAHVDEAITILERDQPNHG